MVWYSNLYSAGSCILTFQAANTSLESVLKLATVNAQQKPLDLDSEDSCLHLDLDLVILLSPHE